MNRICKKCGVEKDITLFVANKECNFGFTWRCKDCNSKINSSPRVRELARKRYSNNREHFLLKVKEYREKYPDRVKENKKKEYHRNIATYKAAYERNYKTPEGRKKYNAWRKNKEATNVCFRLRNRLRVRLNDVIRDGEKKGSAVRDLGCSSEYLKKYLEQKFRNGMTWENHGKIWHIDHIQPLCTFDLTKREQFLRAVNYTNLQPLLIKENLKKGKRNYGIPADI